MNDNTGLQRVYEEIATHEGIIQMLELVPTDMNHLYLPLAQNLLRQHRRTVECIERGEPLTATFYCNAPEIFTAMDIHWYCVSQQLFSGGLENPHLMEDLEGTDRLNLPTDICTMLRMVLYYLDEGLYPKPTMIVPSIEPCDGIAGMHETARNHRNWRGIPYFAPDAPYHGDERSVDYFADQLRQMVSFLQQYTGKSLDMDRLREVIKESNRQYSLWAEYNELRRSIPCPHGHTLAMACFGLLQTAGSGDPDNSRWYQDLIADAERRIQENDPEVPDQRLRVLWFDVQAIWFNDLATWMQQEFGVFVVMDMFSYAPYTTIDTSSEESIFRDLAKRNLLDPPMVRQAQGTVDTSLEDIGRIVKDFKIDCVILPGHMGHKDSAAAVGLMREKCRELAVPFLHIGVDQFDRRYTTIDEMKIKISQFFAAMGLV